MRYAFVAALSSLLLVTACQPADTAPAGLSEADRAAIEQGSQAFADAMNAADWDALAMTYTEDAVLMPPNAESVRGRDAIRDYISSFPPISDFQLTNSEVDGAGDIAYVTGAYTMTLTPEGAEPIVDSGKYIEIRKKQADGSWLMSRDMYSSDIPLPAPPQP